jgi:hypothetical protein
MDKVKDFWADAVNELGEAHSLAGVEVHPTGVGRPSRLRLR